MNAMYTLESNLYCVYFSTFPRFTETSMKSIRHAGSAIEKGSTYT